MLSLIIPTVSLAAGLVILIFVDSIKYEATYYTGAIVTSLSFLVLVACITAIIINQTTAPSQIAKYEELRASVENAHIHDMGIELILEVEAINQSIASNRYWNESIWGSIFIPDKLAELKPLEIRRN
jgi:hypothetical protein